MEKIKVILLGHISNASIREKLPLSERKAQNLFNRLIGKPQLYYSDFAQWNWSTIEGMEHENVELHVIAPHYGLKSLTYEYEERGVRYYFFRPEPLFPWNILEKIFYKKQYREFLRTRNIVKRWIEEIKPDIVNLVGAENPYYSICGLDVENVPLFITCQTVYSNPNRQRLSGNVSKYRWDLEQQLFNKTKYFCCTNSMYRGLITSYVPDAVVFPLVWPDKPFPKLKGCEKKYDFAFFSVSVSAKKGIDSAIEAMGIVREKVPGVTLLVVGKVDSTYKMRLEERIKELDLEDNIIFHDFFPLQEDMFNYVHQARFALLPVKMDFISGTILQAMEMGMPVVSHITSGTPTLNKERETALLSEIGDTKTMAKQMLQLMSDRELAEKMRENGYSFMKQRHENALQGAKQRLEQYRAIIANYRQGTPIPMEMLGFKQ